MIIRSRTREDLCVRIYSGVLRNRRHDNLGARLHSAIWICTVKFTFLFAVRQGILTPYRNVVGMYTTPMFNVSTKTVRVCVYYVRNIFTGKYITHNPGFLCVLLGILSLDVLLFV